MTKLFSFKKNSQISYNGGEKWEYNVRKFNLSSHFYYDVTSTKLNTE